MHWIDFHVLHGIPTALVRFPYPCMEIHPIALFLLDATVRGAREGARIVFKREREGLCQVVQEKYICDKYTPNTEY